jgi:hypothetical protein
MVMSWVLNLKNTNVQVQPIDQEMKMQIKWPSMALPKGKQPVNQYTQKEN